MLVCCTHPSLSIVSEEKNRTDQRASFRVDTKETQQKRLLFFQSGHLHKAQLDFIKLIKTTGNYLRTGSLNLSKAVQFRCSAQRNGIAISLPARPTVTDFLARIGDSVSLVRKTGDRVVLNRKTGDSVSLARKAGNRVSVARKTGDSVSLA